MFSLMLIGAGQIGSRHLQGVSKILLPDVHIDVIDPNRASLQTAQERYDENPNPRQQINFYEKLDDTFRRKYDVVIVATSADIRAKVTEELLSKKAVKYLILEKVLFQKPEEYTRIQELLRATDTKAWVNHPRRAFSFYQTLHEHLEHNGPFHFTVTGSHWGLGCNGLHFLDLFEFLFGKIDSAIDTRALEKELFESRRKGFYEINGTLTGGNSAHTFAITCTEGAEPLCIQFTSDTLRMTINEAEGSYTIAEVSDTGQEKQVQTPIIKFQSQLSGDIVTWLLEEGTTALTPYEEAMDLHLKFLYTMLQHINQHTGHHFTYLPMT